MQSLRDPLFKQRKGRSTEFCLCFIFALLMIATSVEGRFGCFFDEDCRRDVCVFNICVSRPKTTKTCEFNSNCFYSATESCIFSACTPRSSTGGPCDDDEDCSVKGDLCSEQQCSFSAPLDPLLMLSDGNKAPSTTHSNGAGVVVNGRLFVFAGQGSKSTEVFDPATNTWTSKADVPIVCFGHTVAAVEDFVFLIGGNEDGFNVFTTFFRYDTVNDVWETDWPALPEARTRAAAASVGSVVFLFGGATSGNTLRNTILSFDVSSKSNSWTFQKAVFPAATASVSATTIGTDIFLTGGTKAIGGALSRALKYDTQLPDANPSVLSDMLQIREQHSSFYNPSDMRLYALGGESLSAQNTVEYYDTTQAAPGTWVSANAPNYDLIYAASAGLIGSRFYLTGSYYSSQVLQVLDISVPSSIKWSPFPNSPSPKASVFQLTGPSTITAVDTVFRSVAFYNTVSDAWTVGPASFPNSGISNAASAFSSGQLFIMGGYDGESAITNVYALNSAGDSWSFKTSMPEPRIGSCAAASGSQIFLYGGASTSLFVLDTLADSGNGVWRKVPDGSVTPTGVSNCAAVVSGSKLLIFGGSDINAAPTGLIQSFDITQDKWDAPLAATITPRSGLSAVLLKGFVFVIGGTADSFSGLSTVEAFDIATKTVAALKDLPTPRYALGSVTDGTSIFAVGGKVAGGNFPSLERIRSP